MSTSLIESVRASLLAYDSSTRLYALAFGPEAHQSQHASPLLVEGFFGAEALFDPGYRDVIVLSPNAHLDLEQLLGESAIMTPATQKI